MLIRTSDPLHTQKLHASTHVRTHTHPIASAVWKFGFKIHIKLFAFSFRCKALPVSAAECCCSYDLYIYSNKTVGYNQNGKVTEMESS